jgi:hypothetical protein
MVDRQNVIVPQSALCPRNRVVTDREHIHDQVVSERSKGLAIDRPQTGFVAQAHRIFDLADDFIGILDGLRFFVLCECFALEGCGAFVVFCVSGVVCWILRDAFVLDDLVGHEFDLVI